MKVEINAVKFASYYYDQDTGTIIVDRKFREFFGQEHNGIEIYGDTEYIFSFEYYCAEDCLKTSAIYQLPPDKHIWSEGGWRGIKLKPGRHRFEKEFKTEQNQTEFMLGVCQGNDGDAYVWDFKLFKKGEDKNLFLNGDFSENLENWDYPRNSKDSSKPLGIVELMSLPTKIINLKENELLPPEKDDPFYREINWDIYSFDAETPDSVSKTNSAILYREMHSSYDEKSEELRCSLLDRKCETKPIGEIRYLSSKGNDNLDGKTPETAWKTIDKLNSEQYDTALFECGGVYRGNLFAASNKIYASYGEGEKPCLYTGKKNYAHPSFWIKTSTQNIWAINIGKGLDVGNIIFDHGKKLGIKILKTYKNLKGDYQFYHNLENGVIYLYLSSGNPADLHESIETASGYGIHGDANTENVTIDNLCIKYAGLHGIQFSTAADSITIKNCEIGYIGGSMSNWGRLGNGVEFVNSYSNCLVENCWIYQCYDAGYSFQNCAIPNNDVSKRNKEDNMVLRNSLIEYCNYNIEIFGPYTGLVTDSLFEKNICRFAGFGWGSVNRIGSNPDAASNLALYKGFGYGIINSQNFIIKDNVFDSCLKALVSVGFPNDPDGKGPTIYGNGYIQKEYDGAFPVRTKDFIKNAPVEWKINSIDELNIAICNFDQTPKFIYFEK